MRRPSAHPALLAFAILVSCTQSAWAAWPHSPYVNLAVCTAAAAQSSPKIASDGNGGAYTTWNDARAGTFKLFVQHLTAAGIVDPTWTPNGTPIASTGGNQLPGDIIADGSGGAFVAWSDARAGQNDIYVTHLKAAGVDPAWPVNGLAVCTASNFQVLPLMTLDGAGGVIVTWGDMRSGTNNDVYAQHVTAAGIVDPAWTTNGVALCTAAFDQLPNTIITDGAGGAIIAWADPRATGSSTDIYAAHVTATGLPDPAWPSGGLLINNSLNSQVNPIAVPDGSGGALIVWQDARSGTNDIYVMRALASGVVDPTWPSGVGLCTATGDQQLGGAVSDGANGLIACWRDFRTGTGDVYAGHIGTAPYPDPTWPANGLAVCTATSEQAPTSICSDGRGGAIVAWQDFRSGNWDVYAQHVLATGVVDATWPVNGAAVCQASNSQVNATLVTDGASGVIAAWEDSRTSVQDIYAQRVDRFGYLVGDPGIASVRDVPNDQGGEVKLSWNASYLDDALYGSSTIASYQIFRSVAPNRAAALVASGIRADEPRAELNGAPRLMTTRTGAQTYYWEFVQSQSAYQFAGYSDVVPTGSDSTGASNLRTYFLVRAVASNPSLFWNSQPDSGYSVDNLAPATPAPFTGAYRSGTTYLHWGASHEADFADYRLYRGTSADFVPGPGTLVGALADTGYADAGPAGAYYKLSAVDAHGNESAFALLPPTATTDAAPPLARGLWLGRAMPNPAREGAVIAFALPSAGPVTLAIYDQRGRCVRVLAHGALGPGEHRVQWDGRTDRGLAAASGVYFYRLQAAGRLLSGRVALVR